MTIAIISDIHGNLEALNKAFSFLEKEGIDEVFCLGDVVGYGPNPNECVELIRERCEHVVLGNHDAAVLGITDISKFNVNAKNAITWTNERLSKENRNYLKELPYIYRQDDTLFVHASPLEPNKWTYIFSDVNAAETFSSFHEKICFIGHTHTPAIYNEMELLPKTNQFKFKKDEKYLVNVGSVGQSRDGDNRLCFCIFDTAAYRIEFVRLVYDMVMTSNKIIGSGLPPFLAERLLKGY